MTRMYNEIAEEPQILEKLENVNKYTLKALADEINSKQISKGLFAGRGTSDHACIYAQYTLGYKNGITAALGCPSLITLYNARPDLSQYLTLGISQSGKAEDVRSYITSSKESGGISCAITNYEDSPLAKEADYHLFLNCGEEKSVAATKTFTAQMSIIALLSAYISNDRDLLECFNKLPDTISKVISVCDDQIENIANDFRSSEEAFALSRGLTYPIALESRLKLQETCYMKVQGYASSDFYHGPLAQIDENSKVIVYSSKGMAEKDNIDIAKRIQSIGTEPLFVTNNKNSAKDFAKSIILPDTGNEITDAICFSTFAQRLAEKICQLKGLNPDSPRNLKKVTITK